MNTNANPAAAAERSARARDNQLRAIALNGLITSDGWRLIDARLAQTIESEVQQLKSDLDPISTAKLRGGIQVLEMMRSLPSLLLAEAQK